MNVEGRVEEQREHNRDGQVEQHPRHLVAREASDVVMDRVHRPQELAGELALANAPLPAERREDEVHVANERPDDVIRGDLSGRQPADRAAGVLGDRRPDDEVDDGLGDHAQQVHVRRGAVLELRRHLRAHRRQVEVDERAGTPFLRQRGGRGAHSAASCLKTSSMTSSIGGSSTLRSSTSCSASRRAVTRAVSALGTRSVTTSPSRWITSP